MMHNSNVIMKYIRLFVIFILLGFSLNTPAVRKPFNRHYIIVVDQTIRAGNPNMDILFNSLGSWLKGEGVASNLNKENSTIPKSVPFDSNQDAISLFVFGLPGSGLNMKSSFARIYNECRAFTKGSESLFRDVVESLIYPRERYYDNCCHFRGDANSQSMKIDEFITSYMHPLFDGTDPLHLEISANSAITLSHFVYPLIMDFISKNETANEYYLIIVSDFKSGQYSNNDQEDWDIFNALTAGNSSVRKSFEQHISSMRAPFVQADYLHFQSGDVGARGTRLIMKSIVQKSQVFLASALTLSQSSGNIFKISDARIAFDKDPLTTIDSIEIEVSNADGTLCRQVVARDDETIANMLSADREYKIEGGKLDLGTDNPGDVTISYILYTMSHDPQGNDILPLALTARQDIVAGDIPTNNILLRKIMKLLASLFILSSFLAWLIWRGRRRELDVNISPFAQKFIEVSQKSGTIELPCWFYTSGNNSRKVNVKGKISKRYTFSIGGKTKLYVRLQEAIPSPEEGFTYSINRNTCVDFVALPLGAGQQFNFNLDIQINPDKVDVHTLHKCSIMVDFKVKSSFDGFFKHSEEGIAAQIYNFYFIEDLGRSWVGFDPGTSGSCMAIGNPSGELRNPNIAMVESVWGARRETIIPSKIILDNDLEGKDLTALEPGKDYKYGIEAEVNWKGTNAPRYQSIKKLLGYKKADSDMIKVPTSKGFVNISGVSMAHLLVKGLDKDLNAFIERLSTNERVRIVGDRYSLPRRAVVAIPNNYTLPKIQDMIESIRRLNSYKEVRFIYEAEGVLFNYLRKTFGKKISGTERIIVYDMGGATINLTVFQIDYINKNGSTYYHITTLGKIGYAVGGDNIDVGLMEYMFSFNGLPEIVNHHYQLDNKTNILEQILRLKLNIINYQQKKNEGLDVVRDVESFTSFANTLFNMGNHPLGKISNVSKRARLLDEEGMKDAEIFAFKIIGEMIDSQELKDFVYSKVEDAVNEILKYPDVKKLTYVDKLIFAGRSTTFPNIRKIVHEIVKKKFKSISIWNFNDEEIKTSVAYGACWYGVYNGLVTIDNSRLSSAYGFKQTLGNDTCLQILLNQNSKFDEDNMVAASMEVESQFNGDGETVSFYQVMGSGEGNALLAPENRHKVVFLTSIPVSSMTKRVGIEVDRNNIVTCSLEFNTGDEVKQTDIDIETRDITEENEWAYTFATENKDVLNQGSYSANSRPHRASDTPVSPEVQIKKRDSNPKNKKRI